MDRIGSTSTTNKLSLPISSSSPQHHPGRLHHPPSLPISSPLLSSPLRSTTTTRRRRELSPPSRPVCHQEKEKEKEKEKGLLHHDKQGQGSSMVTTRRTGGATGLTSMVASSRPLRPLSSRGAPHRDKVDPKEQEDFDREQKDFLQESLESRKSEVCSSSSLNMKAMACSICKNPNTVRADGQDPPCHVTIQMMSGYEEQVNVPCVSRNLIDSVLDRAHLEAEFLFETQEALQYEVQISRGEGTTTIHGEGWKKLVDEYVVRLKDTVHICCPRHGLTFYVKVERDGVQLSPLNFIAFNGLSDEEMQIIDECVYAPGLRLSFHQARKMVDSVFGESKNTCSIFVHKMTTNDIGAGPLVISKKVVERLKEKRVHLQKTGSLLLVDDLEITNVEASYNINKDKGGRMEIRKGFQKYARKIGLEVDQVVALAFQKRKNHPRIQVCFSIIG